jgi:hypothetical protein
MTSALMGPRQVPETKMNWGWTGEFQVTERPVTRSLSHKIYQGTRKSRRKMIQRKGAVLKGRREVGQLHNKARRAMGPHQLNAGTGVTNSRCQKLLGE